MITLSLDTTTRGGSVALVEDDHVVAERAGDSSRTHAERLPAEILALLDAHRLAPRDVDLFAVAAGPGSFTGLRIGIATIQGLAFASRRPAIAVSALDALAHAATIDAVPGTTIAVWMDAHRREVFASLYRVSEAGPFTHERLQVLDEATVGDPDATLDRWRAAGHPLPIAFVGDGAVVFAAAISRRVPAAEVLAPPLIAGVIGRLARLAAARGTTGDPAAIQPLYVRRPDAEAARDRRVAH